MFFKNILLKNVNFYLFSKASFLAWHLYAKKLVLCWIKPENGLVSKTLRKQNQYCRVRRKIINELRFSKCLKIVQKNYFFITIRMPQVTNAILLIVLLVPCSLQGQNRTQVHSKNACNQDFNSHGSNMNDVDVYTGSLVDKSRFLHSKRS